MRFSGVEMLPMQRASSINETAIEVLRQYRGHSLE